MFSHHSSSSILFHRGICISILFIIHRGLVCAWKSKCHHKYPLMSLFRDQANPQILMWMWKSAFATSANSSTATTGPSLSRRGRDVYIKWHDHWIYMQRHRKGRGRPANSRGTTHTHTEASAFPAAVTTPLILQNVLCFLLAEQPWVLHCGSFEIFLNECCRSTHGHLFPSSTARYGRLPY